MHHFFKPALESDHLLTGEEFQHCVQVLRHQEGDHIALVDGDGLLLEVRITQIKKKELIYEERARKIFSKKPFAVHLFISPTKQIERMEWLVEKAAELQIDEITFLLTSNSERRKLRMDRLQKKALSALKQSKGGFLMRLNDMTSFNEASATKLPKFIAYLGQQLPHIHDTIPPGTPVGLFIGPEGDFTKEEVATAMANGAQPISLGKAVMRTETAGLAVCHAVNLLNRH